MSLKNKVNQRLTDSSNWILNQPESLVLLMIMGSGFAFLFFGVFATVLGFARNWFLMVLFGVFSLLALKQFINMCKSMKKLGFKNALGGICAREFVWHKDKYGKKLGGVKDGNRYESDESSNEQDAEGNGKIGKEVRDIYRKSE